MYSPYLLPAGNCGSKSQPVGGHGEVSHSISVEPNKYVLSTFSVPETMDTKMNKFHTAPALRELTVQQEEKDLQNSYYSLL